MFHKRLLKEFSDNRKYVAGMVIMQWAALLANVALMYVLAAYVGRISGIVKGESLTTSPSDGVLLIVFAAALFVLRKWNVNPTFIIFGAGAVGAVLYGLI